MADTDAADHRAAVAALLWGEQRAARRGPRPTLTLDVIARAGVEAADADGLAAVTMQRVAGTLGVTKMALYRYVQGKDELVALMVEEALGAAPGAGAGSDAGWRAALDAWAREMYERFLRHPWSLEVIVGARIVGPNELHWMERAVAALDGTGLDGGEKLDVAATLSGHVRSLVPHVVAPAGAEAPEQAMAEAITPLLRGREDRFPALKEAFASAVSQGSQGNALDFGLARILDGVELLISRRARGDA